MKVFFLSFMSSFDPTELISVWDGKWKSDFSSPVCGYPVFLGQLVKEAFFPPGMFLSRINGYSFIDLILGALVFIPDLCVCLLGQYYKVFVTASLWYNIKPGIVILRPLSFFSELFWLCGVLDSFIWMSGLFCGSLKRVIGLWMGTALNIGKTFENMAIFTLLILLVHKYMRSCHLLLYSNSFFTILEF